MNEHSLFTNTFCNLKIGYWNVTGLKDKIDDVSFLKELQSYDVCFLSETWLINDVTIKGFRVQCKNAIKLHNRSGRNSGGIVVLIKQKFTKEIKWLDKNCLYGSWLKIDKNTLESDKNLYIGGVYVPPRNSDYAIRDCFKLLEDDIQLLSEDGCCIILGDMNARCGSLNDYLEHSKGDKYIDCDSFDCETAIYPCRISQDDEVNMYGRQLHC